MRLAPLFSLVAAMTCGVLAARPAVAGVQLIERPGQTTAVRAAVKIEGTVRFYARGTETMERPLAADAKFGFLETRLDGRTEATPGESPAPITDPSQLRAVRNYLEAEANVDVGGTATRNVLPDPLRRIVAEGRAEGTLKFSPDALLMRKSVDLLDMPGDPLALVALLPDPTESIEVGQSWTPVDWAGQMLCSIDAIAKSELKCTLKSVEAGQAIIEVSGRVEGARLGAYSKINIAGLMKLDLAAALITSASFNYSESSEIGTISPGVLSTTSVRLARKASSQAVSEVGVPVTVPPQALELYFDAGPWGVRFRHDRDWHVYNAQLEGQPRVVIMRQLDGGNLKCQLNLALITRVAPGSHTPLERFEADIAATLGKRFKEIVSRDQFAGTDGVRLFRTEVAGTFAADDAGEQAAARDMTWAYYLIVAPDGRQCSAIFAYEPGVPMSRAERAIVESIEFLPIAAAGVDAAAGR